MEEALQELAKAIRLGNIAEAELQLDRLGDDLQGGKFEPCPDCSTRVETDGEGEIEMPDLIPDAVNIVAVGRAAADAVLRRERGKIAQSTTLGEAA